MKERKELRREREKHFENADHSFTAAIYGQPVHFMENGEWTEIDNTVELGADGRYENKKNDFKVSFAGEASDEKLITVAKDGHRLSWKMKDALKAAVHPGKKPELKKKKDAVEVTGLHAGMAYKNVLDGVDLEYELRSKTLKENIVLNKPPASGKVVFEIATDLMPEADSGRILFKTGEGKDVFVMAAPFMFDADGKESHAIEVLCEGKRESGKFVYTLIPDEAWMKATDMRWPVIIDPVISSSTDIREIYDNSISSLEPDRNYYDHFYMYTGNPGDRVYRSMIDLELPVMTCADTVTAAVLDLYCVDGGTQTCRVDVHEILEAWDTRTVTWNTAPAYDAGILDTLSFVPEAGRILSLDVTQVVRKWYEKGEGFGLFTKAGDETGQYVRFLASDCGDAYASIRPKIRVSYVRHAGLRKGWSCHTYSVRRAGDIHVSDHNGNLVFEHVLASLPGNRMPFAAFLVYNSCHTHADTGYGKGFRLNYQQTVSEKVLEDILYYLWTDGTGAVHHFRADSDGVFTDEEDADLTLMQEAGSGHVLQDRSGNRSVFDPSGRLTAMSDASGNTLMVGYEGADVVRVTDGAGRVFQFLWSDGHLTGIRMPDGREKHLSYTGDCLTQIRDFDGSVIRMTYSGDWMLNVKTPDGYTVGWSYKGSPLRVSQVTEYVRQSACRHVRSAYGDHRTVFTDERGRTQTFLFDASGRTVCIHDGPGYGWTGEYVREGKAFGRLKGSSGIRYTSAQYLKNPHLFDDRAWQASGSGEVQASVSTERSHGGTGSRSLRLCSPDSSEAQGMYGQYFTLEKGHTYTFSGYVYLEDVLGYAGDGGALLRAVCRDAQGNYVYHDSVPVRDASGEWHYLSVTFDVPEDASSGTVLFYLILRRMQGDAFFDSLQVEEGVSGGRRNLIENNTFAYGEQVFRRGGGTDAQDGIVELGVTEGTADPEEGAGVPGGRAVDLSVRPKPHEALGDRALCITGDVEKAKRFFQVLPVSGKQGDVYEISAWGCGYPLPQRGDRAFGVELVFVRADGTQEYHVFSFESCSEDWQFLSRRVIADSDHAYLWAGYCYNHNEGKAYFSGLSLCKDIYWPSFTYDEEGRIVSCADARDRKTAFGYDADSNITRITTPSGADFEYTYDDRHRITGAVTAAGRKYVFEYDSYGNLVSEKTVDPQDAGAFICSRYAYTPDGDQLLKNTDWFGKETVFEHESSRGNLKSVTDVNGRKTSYTYDVMDRLTEVKRTNTVNGTEAEVKVTYKVIIKNVQKVWNKNVQML